MWNRFFLLILSVLSAVAVSGQDCELTLSGRVTDAGTADPLFLVSVYVEETGGGTLTDSSGYFRLEGLCPGSYHLVFSHIGCEPRNLYIDVEADTPPLSVELEHSAEILDGVLVTAASGPRTTQNLSTLSRQRISDNANETLSGLLSDLTGVSSLRNGSNIAKPVVHGLYGNRLTILNNGIAQSGQQWGNDHSPEIDPLVANKIRVIKGAGALEYPGATFGAVVFVEPSAIPSEPHLHGSGSYFFASNGRGHGLNVQLHQNGDGLAWRLNGTVRMSGDQRTAEYFLNNTGRREANLALQLERNFGSRLFAELYLSTFNTNLGVLRGSHVGNLTDLESSFQRDQPFFTEPDFSYAIDAPRQQVGHQLAKFHLRYLLSEANRLEFNLAGQWNDRREYDVRRSGRSDIPALRLGQLTGFAEGKFIREFREAGYLKVGVQLTGIDNTNNPETGILPLIPDYLAWESAAFGILQKSYGQSTWEVGLRYDNVFRNVAAISRTVPREIVRYNDRFHNLSGTLGWEYRPGDRFRLAANIGLGTRNPAINELYSFGLHQGVSGIEEGDPELRSERSLKSVLTINGRLGQRFSLEGLAYFQLIDDYIFLEPQNEFRLTIRGAFPVFAYAQTNARIMGIDFSGVWQLTENLTADLSGSYIRGDDLTEGIPLVFIPSSDMRLELTYGLSRPLRRGNAKLSNTEFTVENRYVFRQEHLLPEQDFVPPPPGYYLLALRAATNLHIGRLHLRLFCRVENALNVSYRDYLNRLRYFADEPGINVLAGLKVEI